MVVCLEQDADLHMAQLMPLALTVSCFSKIQIGFTFLVPAHLGSPGKRAIKRACVCVCYCCLLSYFSDGIFFTLGCRCCEGLCIAAQTHTRLTPLFPARVSQYKKDKTDRDFTEVRDSEWHWHQLGRMQVCILLQTDNHASTPPLRFLWALPAAQPTASKH